MRTTPIQLTELGEVELVSTCSLHPYILSLFGMRLWYDTLHATERETPTYQFSHKTFNLQSSLPAKYAGTLGAQNFWE